jgi:type II secretory pathway pseudopilin PulG
MRTRIDDERGMTLIEALVATAVLALAVIVALTIYDAARKTFKKGENATVQQETVRIAYDRLTADLRMLGYNADPDGNPARPDEKLEVGLDHAIIFRGDFDADDNTKNNDVEGAFAGGAFDVVTTGNDEVVGYVLSKPDGTGPDTITFAADVDDSPRDGVVANVNVNNVVLNPTSPPYTLYKISLNNDVSTFGTSNFVVRTPVAENIRNLTFQYYSPASTAPIAAPGTLETAAAKATRASVNRFNVSLIGMTKDPDINYNDASDPAAKTYRKFELRGDVIPRNMKMKGQQDLSADVTPPNKPATPTLIPGHCGGLVVTWAANSAGDGVTQYRVNFGTTPGSSDGFRGAGSSPYFLDGLTTGTLYYVSIQALDAAGNTSIRSNEANATVTNTNTPSPPTGASASTTQTNFVRLSWTAVTTNTANVPAGDPAAPSIRDLAGYRVYRGDTSGVMGSGTPYANEAVVTGSVPPWDDTATVNCHTYYYKMTAVDTCGTESASTSAFSGHSTTSTAPAAPTNVQAFILSPGHSSVTWSAVTKDTAGNNIYINAYDVYRSPVMLKTDLSPPAFPSTPLASVSGLTYADNTVPVLTALQTVYYMVKAKDECVNYSAPSSATPLTCAFSGTVAITTPANGAVVAGVVPVTVTVSGGTDTYVGVTITYTHAVSGLTRTFTSATAGTSWTDSGWLANPAGAYTITAVVTNATACTSTVSIAVSAGSAVGCCLSLYPTTLATLSCANGATKCKEVSYKIGNDRCLTAVSILAMTVGWTDYANLKPRWVNARFNGIDMAAVGSWTAAYVGSPNEVGTVTKTSGFATPTPKVPYATPMTSGNTTTVTYVFDKETHNKVGSTDYWDVFGTNQYQFTLLDSAGNPSGITTTCNLPTLTVGP